MIGHKLVEYSVQVDHSLEDHQELWTEHTLEGYWALAEQRMEDRAYSAVVVRAEHMVGLAAEPAVDKVVLIECCSSYCLYLARRGKLELVGGHNE